MTSTVPAAIPVAPRPRARGLRGMLRWVFRRSLRPTRVGVLFLAITMLFGLAAINTGVNLLFLMVGMLLAGILVSGLLSEMAFQRLAVRRLLPRTVHCHEWFRAEIEVKNTKRWLPTFSLWLVERPGPEPERLELRTDIGLIRSVPGQASVRLELEARGLKRGVCRFGSVRLKTRFPFGFFEKLTDVDLPSPVLVFPPLGRLNRELVLGGDPLAGRSVASPWVSQRELLHGIRPYRPGDSRRQIDWKATSRHRSLMVKEFEPEQGREARIVFDPALPEGVAPLVFEHGASLAATLVDEFGKQGDRVELVIVRADEAPHRLVVSDGNGGQVDSALEALALLSPLERAEPAGLEQALDTASGSRGVFQYLITARSPDVWRSCVAGLPLQVVQVDDPAQLAQVFESARVNGLERRPPR